MIFISNSKAFVQSTSLPESFTIETLFLRDRLMSLNGEVGVRGDVRVMQSTKASMASNHLTDSGGLVGASRHSISFSLTVSRTHTNTHTKNTPLPISLFLILGAWCLVRLVLGTNRWPGYCRPWSEADPIQDRAQRGNGTQPLFQKSIRVLWSKNQVPSI